jgi:thymidylate synthase (FAD)
MEQFPEMIDVSKSKQSIELWKQTDIVRHVERCGRICYKSHKKTTDESCYTFINNIIKLGHYSVLEHGSVYLKVANGIELKSLKSPYSKVVESENASYLYTNLRVIAENDPELLDKLIANEFLNGSEVMEGVTWFSPDLDDPYRRYTYYITTDNFISREIVRHRVFSFSQESSRYVNYNNRGLRFIDMTEWLENKWQRFWWDLATGCSEFFYKKLIKNGAKPQIARSVLLACGETNLAMTGSLEQWEAFFKLRSDKAAHPQVRQISDWIKNDLQILTK